MHPEQVFEVDLDQEAIRYENEWLGRQDLVERIKGMIEKQDYRIASVSLALEYLQDALQGARAFQVKLRATDAAELDRHAKAANLSPEGFLRQAALAYMAAQPPPASPQPASVAEQKTVEQKTKANTSRPPAAPAGEDLGETWFKKE